MRIRFQTDGGFGYFPGLQRPLEIDTTALPPDRAATVEQLVRGARLFDRPPTVGAPAPGSADMRSYTISIDDAGRSHTVTLTEPVADASLQALIDHLTAEQRSGA